MGVMFGTSRKPQRMLFTALESEMWYLYAFYHYVYLTICQVFAASQLFLSLSSLPFSFSKFSYHITQNNPKPAVLLPQPPAFGNAGLCNHIWLIRWFSFVSSSLPVNESSFLLWTSPHMQPCPETGRHAACCEVFVLVTGGPRPLLLQQPHAKGGKERARP